MTNNEVDDSLGITIKVKILLWSSWTTSKSIGLEFSSCRSSRFTTSTQVFPKTSAGAILSAGRLGRGLLALPGPEGGENSPVDSVYECSVRTGRQSIGAGRRLSLNLPLNLGDANSLKTEAAPPLLAFDFGVPEAGTSRFISKAASRMTESGLPPDDDPSSKLFFFQKC